MRAVILAGGKGRRLAPYTTVFPKPLVPIGETPILEIVVRQLAAAGITHITIATGHLGELIEAFFWCHDVGVPIDYSREHEPLGTAGPLALIEGLDETFLVMNGDILTTLDYKALVAFHALRDAWLTIAIHQREVDIDFGILEVGDQHQVVGYIEKPTQRHWVSMGIYVFAPKILRYIPRGVRLDFPDLVKRLLADRRPVVAYPFDGLWFDIGRADDYAQAVEVFERMRQSFLPQP